MPEPFPDPDHVRDWIRENHDPVPVGKSVTFDTIDACEADEVECDVIDSTRLYPGCYPSYYDRISCQVVLWVDGYGKVKTKTRINA